MDSRSSSAVMPSELLAGRVRYVAMMQDAGLPIYLPTYLLSGPSAAFKVQILLVLIDTEKRQGRIAGTCIVRGRTMVAPHWMFLQMMLMCTTVSLRLQT